MPKKYLTVEHYTSTSHRLHGHEGECAYLHGHNYRWLVSVSLPKGQYLDTVSRIIDFADLKKLVKDTLDDLFDHKVVLDRRDELIEALSWAGQPITLMDNNTTVEEMLDLAYGRLSEVIEMCTAKRQSREGITDVTYLLVINKLVCYETATSSATFELGGE